MPFLSLVEHISYNEKLCDKFSLNFNSYTSLCTYFWFIGQHIDAVEFNLTFLKNTEGEYFI